MAGPKLSAETERRLKLLFTPNWWDEAARLLIEQCGNNIPFCESDDEHQMERIRFAALKLSAGDIDELRRAIAIAQQDWRDTLVAAGFGHDVQAHQRWLAN